MRELTREEDEAFRAAVERDAPYPVLCARHLPLDRAIEVAVPHGLAEVRYRSGVTRHEYFIVACVRERGEPWQAWAARTVATLAAWYRRLEDGPYWLKGTRTRRPVASVHLIDPNHPNPALMGRGATYVEAGA